MSTSKSGKETTFVPESVNGKVAANGAAIPVSDNGKKPTPQPRRVKRPRVESAELPGIYYDALSCKYWEEHEGKFRLLTLDSVTGRLLALSFSRSRKTGASQIDLMLARIQREQDFDFAAVRLAGWPKGFHILNGERILVLKDTKPVTPTYGGSTLIRDFRERLYGPEQALVRHAWTKLAVQALREGRQRILEGKSPSWPIQQALSIVGEASHGKTLDAMLDVYALTGSAEGFVNPMQYNSGDTSFNEELAESCIHLLDDQEGRDDHNHRRSFGAKIKESVTNIAFRVHGKGKKPVTLNPFRRTIILLNDDLKDIRVLPDMDRGMGDKFVLLKTIQKAVNAQDGHTYQSRRDAFLAAVPDYLNWLETWEIPAEVKDLDGRYGVVSFHNREVITNLRELGNETQMLQFLKHFAAEFNSQIWTTGQIFSRAINDPVYGREAASLGKTANVFGKTLSAAANMYPEFIKREDPKHNVLTYSFSLPIEKDKPPLYWSERRYFPSAL